MASEKILVVDDSPTILRVVQLVLTKAGYQVSTALDGKLGLAAAQAERPDLIVLDFVMPNMNGFQMCKALSETEGLKDTPIILMSAKGDQLGDRFVQVMRIVDYITKPFSPEAIVAVVDHTLGKYRGATPTPEPEPILRPAMEAPPNEGSTETQTLGETDATTTIDDRLADPRLDALLAEMHCIAPEWLGRGSIALAGDLRVVPLAQVLELLERQVQSGVLTVTRPGSLVEVFFRDGKVELARASGVSEDLLLGRFVVRNKLLTREQLEQFVSSRTPSGELFGAQLLQKGLLSEPQLKEAIAQQTREIVYELLRWNFGRFALVSTRDLPAIALDASLGLQVDGILMEGFRRVDEWHLIEREIDNFDLVFLRNEEAVSHVAKGRLTREEQSVLDLVNGKNSVRDVIRQSKMSSFDVSKMLYRLLSIRLIRKRVLPVAV